VPQAERCRPARSSARIRWLGVRAAVVALLAAALVVPVSGSPVGFGGSAAADEGVTSSGVRYYAPSRSCMVAAISEQEREYNAIPPGADAISTVMLFAPKYGTRYETEYFCRGAVPPDWVYDPAAPGRGPDGTNSAFEYVECRPDIQEACFWVAAAAQGLRPFSQRAFVAKAVTAPPGDGPPPGPGPGPGPASCPEPPVPAAGVRVVAESANRRLTTVRVGDLLLDSSVGPAVEELRAAAARRGCEVSTVSGENPDGDLRNGWLEDLLVPLSDGSFLVPGDLHLDAARAATRDAGFGVLSYGRPTAGVMAMATANGLQVRQSTVFVEGGNLLTARAADGSPLVLVGRSSLHVAGFQRQMQGCLPADAGIEQVLEHARTVLATELGVTPSQVVDVADGSGHLDMLARPGPDGVVLVDDPRTMLDALATAKQDPGLTEGQRTLLDLISPKLDSEFDRPEWDRRTALLQQVRTELEAAGLGVVPVPGILPGAGGLLRVNFMNGVIATDTAGQVYYLTNSTTSSRPGWNAPGLERAFQAALAPLGVQVEFLTTADLLDDNGGLDCVTVEHAVEHAVEPAA
jgi:hypothetical protein